MLGFFSSPLWFLASFAGSVLGARVQAPCVHKAIMTSTQVLLQILV